MLVAQVQDTGYLSADTVTKPGSSSLNEVLRMSYELQESHQHTVSENVVVPSQGLTVL